MYGGGSNRSYANLALGGIRGHALAMHRFFFWSDRFV
jgi:hypothetical protein